MNHVLLVDDSEDCFRLVEKAFNNQVALQWASSVAHAQATLERERFDLILLDISLPDGDGYQLCSSLQADERTNRIPVLFLSSRNSVADKVLGFSLGAEDYIPKPFELLELRARVEAKLRKNKVFLEERHLITKNSIQLDVLGQKSYLLCDSQKTEIFLTPIEFKLLSMLMRNSDQVLNRSDLHRGVWGENVHVYNRSVDTHISKLRKKLGPLAKSIRSVPAVGYRFTSNLV